MTKIRFTAEDVLDIATMAMRLLKSDISITVMQKKVVKGKTEIVPVNISLRRRDVYTVAELSRYLNLSERHIKRLIAEYGFPHAKVTAVRQGVNLKRGQIVFTEEQWSFWYQRTLPSGMSQLTKPTRKEKRHGKNKSRPHSRST